MLETQEKSVYLDLVDLCPNGGSSRLITSQLLAIIREGLVKSERSALCASTAILADNKVQLTTAEILSREQVRQIKTKAHEALSEYGKKSNATDLNAEINGLAEEDYQYCNTDAKELHFLVIPLAYHAEALGVLLVCSSDGELGFVHEAVFKDIGSDFSLLLSRIWSQTTKEHEQYKLMLRRSVDGVILCNAHEEILFINRAAKEKLDLPVDLNLRGKMLADLNADYLTEFLRDALHNGMYEINKVVSKNNKQSNLLGVHTELLRNHNNKDLGWMIALRDVTLNWQNDQMRSALMIASHEIKTPLSSIKGAIDLLLETDLGPLSKDQQRCLKVVKDDIQRLNRLLVDILDTSRFDEGVQFIDRRKEVAISMLAGRVISSFQEFANSKNIKLENKIPRTIPTFKGNRDRIQQVLVNLVENGIKYSWPGGRVEIDAELEDSVLKVWVKDSGIGIPESEYETIFDKFKQLDNHTDSSAQGYGLGLSIAKDIVTSTGGQIWVESEIDKGSTFFFTIPV